MLQTNFFIFSYRIIRVFVHVLVGIAIVGITWPFVNVKTRTKLTQWWCQALLNCFNIKLISTGKLPDNGFANTMVLANHISWIDIYALNSVHPLQFIAKSDINNWPILGYLVRKSGTIFINRENRKDTARIVETTTDCLVTGGNVGFFPEGTTTDGTTLADFKSSIVQAAINANATLQPVAIRYPHPNGGINTDMAYAGETTMGESMLRVLKQKESVVELHFLPPINPQTGNRQTLSQTVFDSISARLNLQ